MEDELSPVALKQKLLPAFVCFELSPQWSHGDPCGSTGCPEEKCPLEPSPVASAQMPSPTALGTEHEPLLTASE